MRDLFSVETLVKIFLAVVIALLVAGIGFMIYNARGVTGTVVDKEHVPMRVIPVTQCTGTGTTFTCFVTQQVHPEHWDLHVMPDDGSSMVYREVPEEYWETVSIGDRWTDD